MNKLRSILIVTSSLAATPTDAAVRFVNDQVAALKKLHPELEISILAPHNAYVKTHTKTRHDDFTEYRFHYFWPYSAELLAGRGIAPALKAHKWLYIAIPFLFMCETIATYRLARRLKPDMLYVHWFTPQAITAAAVAKLLRIPLVFTTHASDVAVLKIVPGAKHLVRAVCRRATAYSAVSEQTADRLRQFWPSSAPDLEAKVSIIPMGTDTPLTPSTAALQTHAGKQVILFIGRLVGRKGVGDLITAFAKVYAANPNTVLMIAGDGQDRAKFEAQVAKANLQAAVEFVGFVTGQAKADLLGRADIVCIPSVNEGDHAEGLPVVFMEALAARKLIVASNVTGAQEHVTAGKEGFIVPERDPAALTAALGQALSMSSAERTTMQDAAGALGQRFSWPKIAERQYTVLNNAYHSFHAQKS